MNLELTGPLLAFAAFAAFARQRTRFAFSIRAQSGFEVTFGKIQSNWKPLN